MHLARPMRPYDLAEGTIVRTVSGVRLGRVVDRAAKAFVVESEEPGSRSVAFPYHDVVSLRGGELWVLAEPEDIDGALGGNAKASETQLLEPSADTSRP